ncbi:MAG: hypothetical protein IJ874_07370 [Ruminococcus sp.]|nr:hypothetical protein [Ruminococcus sp.]
MTDDLPTGDGNGGGVGAGVGVNGDDLTHPTGDKKDALHGSRAERP